MKDRASALRWLQLVVISSLCIPVLWAQQGPGFNTTVPSQIMDQFRDQRIQWTSNVWVYANALFGILALIEFAWSAAVMLLEKSDLQSWTSALVRKLMWIGAFYALLLNGRIWIPAIIDSFTQIGQNAAGLGALSPSGVFMQGLSLAGAMMDGASTSAFFTNPGTSFALAFAALLIVISYTIITINFIVTVVESYLVVSVGFLFLGFGGSRWTAPYTERYIGLAVSTGIKIVLLYCLISAGFGLSIGWLDEAQAIATSARPAMTAFDVMGGSPALTGGDLVATAAVVGSAAIAVGGAAVAGVGALAGVGSAVASAGSATSSGGAGSSATTVVASVGPVGSGSSAGGASVSPPSTSSVASAVNGGGARKQPDPPSSGSVGAGAVDPPGTTSRLGGSTTAPVAPSVSSALSSIGGEPLDGSGFETQQAQRGFAPVSVNARIGATGPEPSLSSSSAVRTVAGRDSAASGPAGGSNPSDAAHTGSAGVVTEVDSVQSTDSVNPQQPPAAKGNSALTRAANQLRGFRRRLPSDAAPHATPPRMPIDHEE